MVQMTLGRVFHARVAVTGNAWSLSFEQQVAGLIWQLANKKLTRTKVQWNWL